MLIADDSFFDGQYIAPALLLLYGDVERTGYYEKLGHRKSIMIVLRHLWSLPRHRAAFRLISSFSSPIGGNSVADISASNNEFLSFANGLMNETNLLVMTVMEKLGDIKKNQLLMVLLLRRHIKNASQITTSLTNYYWSLSRRVG